jgi:hypothetical protein
MIERLVPMVFQKKELSAIWYGATNNLARLMSTCHKNVRTFFDATIRHASKNKVTEKEYAHIITSLNNKSTSMKLFPTSSLHSFTTPNSLCEMSPVKQMCVVDI